MWGIVVDASVVAFCLIGAGFFFAGTLGVVRLPDFYSRTHAATKCDTVGAGFITLALCIHNGFDISTLKIALLVVLIFLSSPTAGHALARAAYLSGLKPWTLFHKESDS